MSDGNCLPVPMEALAKLSVIAKEVALLGLSVIRWIKEPSDGVHYS